MCVVSLTTIINFLTSKNLHRIHILIVFMLISFPGTIRKTINCDVNEWPIYQVAKVVDFFAFLYGNFVLVNHFWIQRKYLSFTVIRTRAYMKTLHACTH